MLTLQVTGADKVKDLLDGFSDRRLAAVTATALTRTVKSLQSEWGSELQTKVQAPTPLTANSPKITFATATNLVASVQIRDQILNGIPPSEYLKPIEYGGGRGLKKFEKALVAQGSMPANTYAIPTDNAARDGYGNVRRQVLVQILVQLAGGAVRDGYRRVISASAQKRARAAIKSGKNYVAVLDASTGIYPGIYERTKDERLKMIFAYESSVRYKKTISLMDRAKKMAPQIYEREMMRAIRESKARLEARGKS